MRFVVMVGLLAAAADSVNPSWRTTSAECFALSDVNEIDTGEIKQLADGGALAEAIRRNADGAVRRILTKPFSRLWEWLLIRDMVRAFERLLSPVMRQRNVIGEGVAG